MIRFVSLVLVLSLVLSGCSGITVKANVEGAQVSELMPEKDSSGQPRRRSLGRAPCEIELVPNKPRTVGVSAPGYAPQERTLVPHRSGGLVALVYIGDVLSVPLIIGIFGLIVHSAQLGSDPGFCAVFDESELVFQLVPGSGPSSSAAPSPATPSAPPAPSVPPPAPAPAQPAPPPTPAIEPKGDSQTPRRRFCAGCGSKFERADQKFCAACGKAR